VTVAPTVRTLAVDLRAKAPVWRIPERVEREFAERAPAGWRVTVVSTDTVSDGDGGHAPSDEALAALAGAEIYFGFGITRPLFAAARHLKWVHSAAAGVTNVLFDEMRASDVILTNSAGIHAVPMAEYVVAALLHFWRGLDITIESQRSATWLRSEFMRADTPIREAGESTVLIVGTGGIGSAAAIRLEALGATCIGLRRRVSEPAPPGFKYVTSLDEIDALLPSCDAVVLAAPFTPATRGLMNARRLDRLPPHAVVVNVARGALLDEAALAERLSAGKLRGAALDVFQSEPLAPDSPLWPLRRALVTPHISAVTARRFWEREAALFHDNWRRYVSGAPLTNVVNKDAGY